MEVVGSVTLHERCRPRLAGDVAGVDELLEVGGISRGHAELVVPGVGDGGQVFVALLAERLDRFGQGIVELLVLAGAEAISVGLDAGSPRSWLVVQRDQFGAVGCGQYLRCYGIAVAVEGGCQGRPVPVRHGGRGVVGSHGGKNPGEGGFVAIGVSLDRVMSGGVGEAGLA